MSQRGEEFLAVPVKTETINIVGELSHVMQQQSPEAQNQ